MSTIAEAPQGTRARPAITQDTQFFWDGVAEGELRIQQCNTCQRLHHPPRPMCDNDRSTDMGWVVSEGKGEIYSFVIHHYPPLPGVRSPHPVVLVQLDEGTRFLSHMIDGTDPSEVRIGRRVQLEMVAIDDELTLPIARFV